TFDSVFHDDAATLHANTRVILQEFNTSIRTLTQDLQQSQTSNSQLRETLETGAATLARIREERRTLQERV
ncbi:hypothetical protein Q9L58_010765, partial [Maublancomyces gigas]